jgi:hypothetical protein
MENDPWEMILDKEATAPVNICNDLRYMVMDLVKS